MKLVLAGGSGHLGRLLVPALRRAGHDVVLLSRREQRDGRTVRWDGRTLGAWVTAVDGADAVINLAGRSVNCRYSDRHLQEMMDSRVQSTRVLGRAIEQAEHPPRAWLQMSTATIYAHRFDAPNDEATGQLGGEEPNAPRSWRESIAIARAWERAVGEANTPQTRKVALRTAMVMAPGSGGAFTTLLGLTRLGLGGPISGGSQYISWIHDRDFVRAVRFLLDCDGLAGPVNLASPQPLPQREFMAALRAAGGTRVGLPATAWMVEIGAFLMRTETELVLKSRRVVPARLMDVGFTFEFPQWPAAACDLVARWRRQHRRERADR